MPKRPSVAAAFESVALIRTWGRLVGVAADPIYGNKQQRFNVYRPSNLAQSGYCQPILIWANGYRDNPEQNPPDCVVDGGLVAGAVSTRRPELHLLQRQPRHRRAKQPDGPVIGAS